MRRFVLGLLVLVVVGLGGCWVLRLLTPDERLIERALESLVDEFNAGRAGGFCDQLHPDYLEEVNRIDRDLLRQILQRQFLMGLQSGSTSYRAEIDQVQVQVTTRGQAAEVTLEGRLFEKPQPRASSPPSADPVWTCELTLGFVHDEEGWRVKRSRYRTTGGSLPRG